MNVQFSEVGDEAAFYGPKVDVQFKSIIGREETMSTIQLDFAAKKRFELTYIDQNGNQNNDVFVIHRAPLSVHERLLAFLIEHYAGAFPLWLSPTQVSLIPIAERHNDYAKKVLTDLTKVGLRAEIDSRSESMQKKIRIAQSQKVNYMIIIGDKEVETNNLSIRTRAGVTGNISTSNLIEKLTNLNSQRSNEEIVF
jgi:threonyl-tRNA synthetase